MRRTNLAVLGMLLAVWLSGCRPGQPTANAQNVAELGIGLLSGRIGLGGLFEAGGNAINDNFFGGNRYVRSGLRAGAGILDGATGNPVGAATRGGGMLINAVTGPRDGTAGAAPLAPKAATDQGARVKAADDE